MPSLTKLHTTPIACTRNGDMAREWFVQFKFYNQEAQKWQVFKCLEGINKIHSKPERLAEIKALREAREIWLKQGWNPITDRHFKDRHQPQQFNELKNIRTWTFTTAIKFALQNKKLAKRSKESYSTTVKYLIGAANELYFESMAINQFERKHCKALINKMTEKYKLSNKGRNKHLSFFKSLFTELVEWECFPHGINPAHGIADLKEEETIKFEVLTPDEKEQVREYLYLTNYPFYVFTLTLYYTGIRPNEILHLQVKDFKKDDHLFRMVPYSENVKNSKERWVAIHPNLYNFILKMELDKHKPTDYIFSDHFLPGPVKINPKSATYYWNKYVCSDLDIDKKLYGLKHLGADDFIEAGVKEENMVDHLGHSSKFITRRYSLKGKEKSREVVRNANVQF
jgi:integrase